MPYGSEQNVFGGKHFRQYISNMALTIVLSLDKLLKEQQSKLLEVGFFKSTNVFKKFPDVLA